MREEPFPFSDRLGVELQTFLEVNWCQITTQVAGAGIDTPVAVLVI